MEDDHSEGTKESKKRGGKGSGSGNGRLTNDARAQRDLEILRLRLAPNNKGLQEIADIVGMGSAGAVASALNRIFEEHKSVEVETHRQLEVANMEASRTLLNPYLQPDLDTDNDKVIAARLDRQLQALAEFRKIGEYVSKLHGAFAPVKQEVSGPDGAAPFTVVMPWPAPDPNTEVINEEDLRKS